MSDVHTRITSAVVRPASGVPGAHRFPVVTAGNPELPIAGSTTDEGVSSVQGTRLENFARLACVPVSESA